MAEEPLPRVSGDVAGGPGPGSALAQAGRGGAGRRRAERGRGRLGGGGRPPSYAVALGDVRSRVGSLGVGGSAGRPGTAPARSEEGWVPCGAGRALGLRPL